MMESVLVLGALLLAAGEYSLLIRRRARRRPVERRLHELKPILAAWLARHEGRPVGVERPLAVAER